jgi:transcriptional regulator with XRE-family HTH domain
MGPSDKTGRSDETIGETTGVSRAKPSGVHPADAHIGRRMRERRTVLGISQQALAEPIGISFQQVQKYERGINRLSAGRLWRIARVLDVAPDYFFEGLPGNPAEAKRHGGLGHPEAPFRAVDAKALSRRETLELARAFFQIEDVALSDAILTIAGRLAERDAPKCD